MRHARKMGWLRSVRHPVASPDSREPANVRKLKTGVVLVVTALACRAPIRTSSGTASPALPPGAQAISFLGDTLKQLPLSAATRERYEKQLGEAKRRL